MKKSLIALVVFLSGSVVWAQPFAGAIATRDSNGITLLKTSDGSWLHLYGSGAPTFTTFLTESVPNNTIYTNSASGVNYYYSSGTWTIETGGAAASAPFSGLTSSTNSTAAMVVGTGASLTFTGTAVASFRDNTTWIVGATDPTKRVRFEVDGFTTGNDRIVTIPGLTGNETMATLASTQTWAGVNTFSNFLVLNSQVSYGLGIGAAQGGLYYWTTGTPDGGYYAVGPLSNSLHVGELADVTFDFNNGPAGTSAATDPQIVVHSHNQDTTQYSATTFYGSAGQALKTLTESSATAVIAVPVASDAATGGALSYTVFASDGTGQQARFGQVRFAAVAEGTTTTCSVYGVDQGPVGVGGPTANPDQTEDGSGAGALTTGTLTYAWTVTQGTNLCTLNLNAVSSLTQTTLQVKYRLSLVGPGQPSPQ